jgi:exo-beta-1,3-glucanase (GH17 family)/cellulose synthase/poly-beta-1,6-N-acetylglucosamine synthase-like glycosyltransferase
MRKNFKITTLLSALLLATIVACVQFGLWSYFNPEIAAPEYKGQVGGFAYSPFQRNQSPLERSYPSEGDIAGDLDLLSSRSQRVRTYSSLENASIATLAESRGIDVTAGSWLSEDRALNERELEATITTARDHRNVSRVIVGNETLLRGDISAQELMVYLDRARAAVHKPVSTAEPWHIWLKHPELAQHVDFIAVHLLPYHEGIQADKAVDFALGRYEQLVKAFPGKKVVIGEIGWPSAGPSRAALLDKYSIAVPSVENASKFTREFLVKAARRNLDYYLMEAIDQPWKVSTEGWEGQYWGMYTADRQAKYALTGTVQADAYWEGKAIAASLIAFLPILILCLAFARWSATGKLVLGGLVQACVSGVVIGAALPEAHYFTAGGVAALIALVIAMLVTSTVVLSNGFEFAEALFNRGWRRHYKPMTALPPASEPFVSVHLACYNEPPEMVIATIDSLSRLDYSNYEVLVIDNNTQDEALWKPVQAHCAKLGRQFRFFHLPKWPGFKAGALNFALEQTDARAEVVGVVDADYMVSRDWLSSLVPHFSERKVAVVQAPQAHREYEHHFFKRMANWEFDGFFRIGMHHRHERNALIQHGTMTLVRRSSLQDVGGWSEWCICEDTELGLRLLESGQELRYVDEVLGVGLTPDDFSGLKSQRFRWAFGAMQILKGHIGALLGKSKLTSGQRYHFLTGWMSWFGDALQFVFAFGAILWTIGMLLAPKTFNLPIAEMLLPVLTLLVVKATMGPILYQRLVKCSWADIFGSALASLGLSHAIARGVFAGLTQKKGEFVRTPKGWKLKGGLASFSPIREEMAMFSALALGAYAMVQQRGTADHASMLWVGMLALQTLPYIAAMACQAIAHLPENKPQTQLEPSFSGAGHAMLEASDLREPALGTVIVDTPAARPQSEPARSPVLQPATVRISREPITEPVMMRASSAQERSFTS